MLCSLFRGEGEVMEDEDVTGEARLPFVGCWLTVGTLEGLKTDSGLVLEWEDEGEWWDLAGDMAGADEAEAGEVGGCWEVGLLTAILDCLAASPSPGLLLVLLLLISFIMCSCNFCFVSAFFSHSSCRMSCWVSGLVTLNLRNCWSIRGSSSGVHILHLSRLAPWEFWN